MAGGGPGLRRRARCSSHRSAATLWCIRLGELFRPEVTHGAIRGGWRRSPAAGPCSQRADRTTHRGIPVTSPARTLADLAHVLDHDELTRALREAMFRRLYDPDGDPGRPDPPAVQGAEGPVRRSTMLEDRFLVTRAARCIRQHRIGAKRYDFAWPQPARRRARPTPGSRTPTRSPSRPTAASIQRVAARRLAGPAQVHLGRPHPTAAARRLRRSARPSTPAHRRRPAPLHDHRLVGDRATAASSPRPPRAARTRRRGTGTGCRRGS